MISSIDWGPLGLVLPGVTIFITAATPIVGHKIFFSPAPVMASALSSRCFTLSQGCVAPEQNLGRSERPGGAVDGAKWAR